MRKVLNLGCGDNLIRLDDIEVINVDANPEFKPDVVCNITVDRLKLEDKTVDTIWIFHMIEHITKTNRPNVLLECNRVLKTGGNLILTYPEFSECSKRFLDNTNGNREFWEATLYGRQAHGFDFHVVPMHTPTFKHELIDYGFKVGNIKSELEEEYNTIIDCEKIRDVVTRESIIAKEVCGVN